MVCFLKFPDRFLLQLLYEPLYYFFKKFLLSLSYSILIPLAEFSPSVGTIMEDDPGKSVLRVPWSLPLQPLQKLLHTSFALTCSQSWPGPFLFPATVLTFTCCIFQSMANGYVSRCAGQLVFSSFAFSHIDTENIQICGYWWFVTIRCKCCPQFFGFDIQFVLFLSGYFER